MKKSILHTEGFFPSDKRWIYYRSWRNLYPRGEIVAIHGAAEHSGRYQDIGISFAEKGYNFYICDLCGHGRSEGKRGHVQQFEDYLVDISNFYAFLRVHKKIKNPYLLGHSMGGLIATLFTAMGQCHIKGLILSGPLFKLKLPVPFWKKHLAILLSTVYPNLLVENSIDPLLLCHDQNIIQEYITDSFVYPKISVRWFAEIFRAMKNAQTCAPYIDVPSLILHGEEDGICDPEASKAFFRNLNVVKKDLYLIKGGYHEIFNEFCWMDIQDSVVEWMQKDQTN